MTVRQLYKVATKNNLFIRTKNGVKRFEPYNEYADREIKSILSVGDYPMFKNVIEIELKGE